MNLSSATRSGLKWLTLSQGGRQVLQFVVTAALARLLKPADFGLMGMTTVIVGFLALFRELDISVIVRKNDPSPLLLSSLFWINAFFGTVATVLLYMISGYVALFYGEPLVGPLLRLLSLSFFISSLGNVQQALLEREMAFGRLAMVELAAQLVGAVVGIGGASLGWGVWSLALQTLTVALVTTLMVSVFAHWRPKGGFSWSEFRSVLGYSANLTGFSIGNYLVRNADNLLIGRFLGAQALGYYSLAYKIFSFPQQVVTSVSVRVMFPVLSRVKDDNAYFRSIYLKTVSAIAMVTFPMSLGLGALALPFVDLVLGPKWLPIALLLLIFAPVGVIQSVGSTVGMIYLAKGRSDWMFRWGMATGILAVLAFIIGLKWGIYGVGYAYTALVLALAFPNFAVPFKLVELPLRSFFTEVKFPLLSAVAMSAALWGVESLIGTAADSFSILALLVPLGVVLYLALLWFLSRDRFLSVLEFACGGNRSELKSEVTGPAQREGGG